MEENYRRLSGGVEVTTTESILERKVYGIKLRDHFIFLVSLVLLTLVNAVFRGYLYQLSLDYILRL